MYHMDIPKTRQYDTGTVEVIARNSCGEALASTELKVIPRHDDYRGVLKNSPRRKYKLKHLICIVQAFLIYLSLIMSFILYIVIEHGTIYKHDKKRQYQIFILFNMTP